MTRRIEREHEFKLLFSTLFYNKDEMEEQLDHYFIVPTFEEESMTSLSEEEAARLKTRVEDIASKKDILDQKIDSVAKGWKTARMGKVELTILRLALYEILYDDEIPDKVSINEAVELAKKFGGSDSGAFVNGVLAKLI